NQAGLALRQCCRHHRIFRCADRDYREGEVCPAQSPSRLGMDVARLDRDAGTHGFQRLEMQIDRSGPNGTAAGQRHLGAAEASQKRPQHENGGTHLSHQIIGGAKGLYLVCLNLEHHALLFGFGRNFPQLHTQRLEKPAHGGDVGQARKIAEAQLFARQESCSQKGERGVLRATDLDVAAQRPSAADQYSVHGTGSLLLQCDRGESVTGPCRRRMLVLSPSVHAPAPCVCAGSRAMRPRDAARVPFAWRSARGATQAPRRWNQHPSTCAQSRLSIRRGQGAAGGKTVFHLLTSGKANRFHSACSSDANSLPASQASHCRLSCLVVRRRCRICFLKLTSPSAWGTARSASISCAYARKAMSSLPSRKVRPLYG